MGTRQTGIKGSGYFVYFFGLAQIGSGSLTMVLGRTAAYENKTVTWDDMIRANKRMVANLKL